ncbi:MAG: glutamine--fructose-6-phosphate transaminase (isomerizing) [Candidatus Omnitrophica bacterium]|nr:glutamine--fructose-6-phosphate transaminase (isomerizing) [Candidatus Omnitrophota bacterium]
MCGIIGYAGKRNALPVLMEGLSRLEYRGYDSAGIAYVDGNHNHPIHIIKEKGKLIELRRALSLVHATPHIGIGHTRWATHGEPSRRNAHPHLSQDDNFAVVHNGIIENYQEIKSYLKRKGYTFRSETDTEVLVHLVQDEFRGDVLTAFRNAIQRLEGFFAFVLISRHSPNELFFFKRSNPLVVGVGKKENFVASDVPAILPYTKRVVYLGDDEVGCLNEDSFKIVRLKKPTPVQKRIETVPWNLEQAEKGGYHHFMLKEIYEQPRVAEETIRKRLDFNRQRIVFDTLSFHANWRLKHVRKIFMVSCGTAYHAGIAARYMFENIARVPTEVCVSSEFRYSDPILSKSDIVVLVTQSGETADTLAALREARKKGAYTLAIVNVVGSTIAREADCVIYTHAGPEIGVASTKAYTVQLLTLALLALHAGYLRNKIPPKQFEEMLSFAKHIPSDLKKILQEAPRVDQCAKKLYKKHNFIYLARGFSFPNALEGALKLKEISYAHAHGYAAGEMKHGPIALIDKEQPVICIIPQSKTYDKMLSNMEEIKAREGIIVAVATKGDRAVSKFARWTFYVPKTSEFFSTIYTVVPLQLFAYRMAVLNGRDVDQPRNLAKSVTVE